MMVYTAREAYGLYGRELGKSKQASNGQEIKIRYNQILMLCLGEIKIVAGLCPSLVSYEVKTHMIWVFFLSESQERGKTLVCFVL